MKFCKDCAHYIAPHMGIAARCESKDVGAAELPHVYAVHGIALEACTVARQEGHACGPEGKFHIPAPLAEGLRELAKELVRIIRRDAPR